MMRLPKTLFAIALAALPFALIGAGNAPGSQPAPGSVMIQNPGGRDFSGFLIVVEPSGRAFALDGAGHASGQLQTSLTQTLFADLAAAGPLAQLPERSCDEALLVGWNGQRSSNLGCSADPRSMKLIADITAIQRALYVQSYRVATTQGTEPSGYAPAVTQNTGAGPAPAGGYARGSTSTARNAAPSNYSSNSAAPYSAFTTTGSKFGNMNSNVGAYIGPNGGNLSGVVGGGATYAPGSFAGNFLGGFLAGGTGAGGRFQGGGNVTIGQLSDTAHFSSPGLSGSSASGLNSTIPHGTFNNGGSFSSGLNNNNVGSGLQNQQFSGSGTSFTNASGINGVNTTPH
jgi:hypothetical protein